MFKFLFTAYFVPQSFVETWTELCFIMSCLPCSLKQLDCKVSQQSFIEEIKLSLSTLFYNKHTLKLKK